MSTVNSEGRVTFAAEYHLIGGVPRLRAAEYRRVIVSRIAAILLLIVVGVVAWGVFGKTSGRASAGTRGPVPPASVDDSLAAAPGKATAVFASGCFWGTQSVFERVKGVVATTAGYAGGSADTATYDQVTTETTGHAESVKVVYDPSKITYGQLLRVFFSVAHDPTQLNRQGPDVGTSYRSAIFYGNDDQRKIAEAYIAQLDAANVFGKKIVTQVTPLKGFYDAESYHQDYALHNPNNPYILVCDRPKVEALKAQFPELFQDYKGK
jgi:peptide-methionine (S)-S-oxide reductase